MKLVRALSKCLLVIEIVNGEARNDRLSYEIIDFHCAVAVSIISINNMSMEPEEPVEALSHLSKTFNLVNERIAEGKADATSDGTIAVIVIMSKYGLAAGHAQQGPIHLDGLQRMVEMRGGMTTLTNYKPSMTQKIFR
jgi:hypothetical protein